MTRPNATAPRRPAALRIRAAAPAADEAEILIYDDIGAGYYGEGVEARRFVEDLKAIDAATLHVRINSAGGAVFEGLAIYNALRRHPARVVTHIDGLAASIASIIALAGDEVRIAANAFLMIHNPEGMAVGTAATMREMADTLDQVGESLVGIYTRRTLAEQSRIRAWMDAETWFNAEEAQRYRFVDAVSEGAAVTAAVDLARFRNVPDDLAARLALSMGQLEAREAARQFAAITARIDRAAVVQESTAVLHRAGEAASRYGVDWDVWASDREMSTLRTLVHWALGVLGRGGGPRPVPHVYRRRRDDQPVAFALPGVCEIAVSTEALASMDLPYIVGHEVEHVFQDPGLDREEAERLADRAGRRVADSWWRKH